MKTKNVVHSTGPGAFVIQGDDVKVQFAEKRKPKMEYPGGSIGADLLRRNYIRYLAEWYFRYREADVSFGRKAVRRFSYAVLFKNIESHFKAPTTSFQSLASMNWWISCKSGLNPPYWARGIAHGGIATTKPSTSSS